MQLMMFVVCSAAILGSAFLISSIRDLAVDKSLRTYRLCWLMLSAVTAIGLLAVPLFREFFTTGNAVMSLALSALVLMQSVIFKNTLRRIKTDQRIEGISLIDPVAGVYNQFYLEQRLDSEIALSHRYNTPLTLLALEVSGFADFVDEYGHQGAELALRRVAERLQSVLRETDVVTRQSEGRFLLILPNTPESSSLVLMQRLRRAVDGLIVIDGSDGDPSVQISICIGIAHCMQSTLGASELIAQCLHSLNVVPTRLEFSIPQMVDSPKTVASSSAKSIPSQTS